MHLEPGDWVGYEVRLDEAALLAMVVHGPAARVRVRVDDTDLPPNGRTAVAIHAGQHEVRVTATIDAVAVTPIGQA